MLLEHLAVGGEGDVAPLSHEQGRAQLGFQFFDGGAEGGLGNVQPLGRARYVLQLRQLQKIMKLEKFHGHLHT